MGFLSKKGVRDVVLGLVLVLAMVGLILRPKDTIGAAQDGLMLCYNVIIPTLFPFFVLSSMLVELGLVKYLGQAMERIMRPLFNVSGACAAAFALGFVGGYPTGAKTAISIYEKGLCTKTEAERLLAFCNNSGPAFILGVVGAGIFSSGKAGVLLYISHIVASVLVGLIFRFYKRGSGEISSGRMTFESVGFTEAFTGSVKGALNSTLGICAFVVFFTVTIKLLVQFGAIPWLARGIAFVLSPVGIGESQAENLITGLLEVSSGVWSLRDAAGGMRQQLAMAAFMLGWAGISVHCQVLSFIGQSGLSTRTYIAGKMAHGLISALLAFIFAGVFDFSAPVSSYLAEQLKGLASLDFLGSLRISLLTSACILVLITLWFAFSALRRRRRHI